MFLNGAGGVKAPGAKIKPRVAPSQWPGDTHLERLQWFATDCTPEPDMLHVREWAVNLLSRATPEAAEASFLTQPTQTLDRAVELKQLALPTL